MVEQTFRKLSNFEAFPVDELCRAPFTVQFGIRTSIKVYFSLLALIKLNVPVAKKDVVLKQFNI